MSAKLAKKEKKFICSICDEKLSSNFRLREHTLNVHVNLQIDNYNCPSCSFIGQSESELDNHLAMQCANYGKYVEYLKLLKNKRSKWNCNSCGYQTRSKVMYKRHIKKHGFFKELQVFACPECSYATSRQSLISSHILTHTQIKKYKCSHCTYSAIRSDYLRKHIVTHEKDYRPYKCNFCDYTAIRKDYLKRHIAKHTQYPSLKCTDCDFRCNDDEDLKAHLKSHRQGTLFKCTNCDFETQEKDVIQSHVGSHSEFSAFMCHEHHSTFECDSCQMTFLNSGELNVHQCTDESNTRSCETNNNNSIISHTPTHSNRDDSNVDGSTEISNYDEGILLKDSENVTIISDYAIVELPDAITFLTDSKFTGKDLVITPYPIEHVSNKKEEVISHLSTDPESLILNIEY